MYVPCNISILFTQSKEIHTYGFLMLAIFKLINQGLINNFSLFLDSVQNFGIHLLEIWVPNEKRLSSKKIHALLLSLLNSEDDYSSKKQLLPKLQQDL